MFSSRLVSAESTASGTVKLDADEVQYAIASDVNVYDEKEKPVSGLQQCKLVLTGYGIYLNGKDQPTVWMRLGLNQVIRSESHVSIVRVFPRIDVFLTSMNGIRTSSTGSPDCVFYFPNQQSAKDFSTMLVKAISKRSWEKREMELKMQAMSASMVKKDSADAVGGAGNANKGVGLAGIMNKQEAKRTQAKELTNEAFSDLEALMDKAQDMIKLVDRYSAILETKRKSAGSGDASVEDEFNSILNSVGIVNPVTKKNAGAHYHEELARQISDYLSKELTKHYSSGIIALTDLYAMFNRARGMNLVSPNDLVQACSLMERLRLPYTMKRFESGVIVVQSNVFSSEMIASRIKKLLDDEEKQKKDSISAIDVAKALSLSIQLALEQLVAAEKMLIICRDETVDGVRFFRNRFLET